jgi:hypothetical protein
MTRRNNVILTKLNTIIALSTVTNLKHLQFFTVHIQLKTMTLFKYTQTLLADKIPYSHTLTSYTALYSSCVKLVVQTLFLNIYLRMKITVFFKVYVNKWLQNLKLSYTKLLLFYITATFVPSKLFLYFRELIFLFRQKNIDFFHSDSK